MEQRVSHQKPEVMVTSAAKAAMVLSEVAAMEARSMSPVGKSC